VVIDPTGEGVDERLRAPTFDQAKAQFAATWEECRAWAIWPSSSARFEMNAQLA
jgi:hypothetical protein